MAAPQPPPRGGGMSLYANLLGPKADSSTSISRAPVVFKQPGAAGETADGSAARKSADPSLRFQPIRRPQQTKAKPKAPGFHKTVPNTHPPAAAPSTGPAHQQHTAASSSTAAQPPRSTLADWAATEDDEYLYGAAGAGEKRQRGGRRRKKKKVEGRPLETDWDELYDPSRPTNVDEYLHSDERIRELQEWKAVLYAHRRRQRAATPPESDSDEERPPVMNYQFAPPGQFAPPASYGFAPPPPDMGASRQTPPPPPPDETADDVFARRLALSGARTAAAPRSPTPPRTETDGATISRAPVRYDPPPPEDDAEAPPDAMDVDPPLTEAEASGPAPRANRPGQAGFAARLMSKYGWTRGTGLGAESDGIVNPLRVQVEKRKRRSDAEGGGFAEPGGRGRIIGGKRRAAGAADAGEGGGFGAMSAVIVLRGMLEGMEDLAGEIEQGLGQEIGEECGEKYGRVERLYIDILGRQVFIKFTDQVSALRAVTALDGRIFNGNAVTPRFYDADKFEQGIYG